ncbi:MAG: hypothetical protein NTV81_02910 [Candidatus Komeilibacteria bacterium]|nr:hypothetical protein [Candidatus Komeilibacteria bacterium]
MLENHKNLKKWRSKLALKKILSVCIGNSDRSPAMAAVLRMFLEKAGHDEVVCESAGIGENAAKVGGASDFAVVAAKRIGLDITGHCKRHITSLSLQDYDLIICASKEIADKVIKAGADKGKVCNVQVSNPWPCSSQKDYDSAFCQILAAMYRVAILVMAMESGDQLAIPVSEALPILEAQGGDEGKERFVREFGA